MNAPAVLVYTGPRCPFCDAAKRLLQKRGAPYREVRVDRDPQEFASMLERSGGRRSVPQIFIGAHHVGGFDELSELHRDGRLDALLASAACAPAAP